MFKYTKPTMCCGHFVYRLPSKIYLWPLTALRCRQLLAQPCNIVATALDFSGQPVQLHVLCTAPTPRPGPPSQVHSVTELRPVYAIPKPLQDPTAPDEAPSNEPQSLYPALPQTAE